MSTPDHGPSPRADQRHVLSLRVDVQLFDAVARDATRLGAHAAAGGFRFQPLRKTRFIERN